MCEKFRKERIEPMKGTEFPDRPWARVGVDFFQHKDKQYLLAVDYFSRDVEICLVPKNVNTAQTVVKMKKIFSRHGIPDILFTDNGPQFDSHEAHNIISKISASKWRSRKSRPNYEDDPEEKW